MYVSWCPQLPLGRQHVVWQLANQGRLVKLLQQFIWLQFHLWIYQHEEDESLDVKKPLCAGSTVKQNRTGDVHNLSEEVSSKSDTVCGNTQNSPLLFFVFWKPINSFMLISTASACMFCLASRTQYLLCYGAVCVSLLMLTSRDWHLMWGIGVFCCGIVGGNIQNQWWDEVPAAVYTKLKQGIHMLVGLTLNFQAENYLSYSALLIVKFFVCCRNKVNGWFDSLVWLLLWQKDWWKSCFSFQTDKASMLDEVYEYTKYLRLRQVCEFQFSRYVAEGLGSLRFNTLS
jgi:hypothetical protein